MFSNQTNCEIMMFSMYCLCVGVDLALTGPRLLPEARGLCDCDVMMF